MSWGFLDADWRDVGAYSPRESRETRAARATCAGLWQGAWLGAWRGVPAERLRPCYGLSTSSSIGIGVVRQTGQLLREHGAGSRPSKTKGNSCRRAQGVDGPRYDG